MNHIRDSIDHMRNRITNMIREHNAGASDAAIMEVADSITREIVKDFSRERLVPPKRKKDLSDDELDKLLKGNAKCDSVMI